jgi:hypothetical protein
MATEENTQKQWRDQCLITLQSLNSSYRINRNIKGRFMEFVRTDESGMLFSHNFIKIRDSYYYSAGLLLDEQPTTLLNHCLLIGSRFDHNRTIWRQYHDDLGLRRGDPGCPSGIWSFGPWRSNTMSLLPRGMEVVETHLLPFYHQVARNGKMHLAGVLRAADEMLGGIPPNASEEDVRSIFSEHMGKVKALDRELHSIDGLALAVGGQQRYRYGPPEPGFDVLGIPPELIVLYQLPVFFNARDRLKSILKITQAL